MKLFFLLSAVCMAGSMSVDKVLKLPDPVYSVVYDFDWNGPLWQSVSYLTSSGPSGERAVLVAANLTSMAVLGKASLATEECPSFLPVGAARLTLEPDVARHVFVAQGAGNGLPTKCRGRVLSVDASTMKVSGSLNAQYPNVFQGEDMLDVHFGEDEIQFISPTSMYSYCPLCSPVYLKRSDFSCGPLKWGALDRFVADYSNPGGGMLSTKSGILTRVMSGEAAIPSQPSYGRPNASMAVGDCCYFMTVVATIDMKTIIPPYPPRYTYFSSFRLAQSRDSFATKEVLMGGADGVKSPWNQYMLGPQSFGVVDTEQNNGAAYWLAFKTDGVLGEGTPVIVRIDFNYPSFSLGSAVELTGVATVHDMALAVRDHEDLYLAVTMEDGTGAVMRVHTKG